MAYLPPPVCCNACCNVGVATCLSMVIVASLSGKLMATFCTCGMLESTLCTVVAQPLQVMPFTGYRVASLLGEKDFQPRQLLEPNNAIRMGARYLSRLMGKFDNTIPLVAAGYNAGPHRVNNWLASFGHLETDEFIEHIPFLETRNYVKKVVSNCYVYSHLYGNKKDLFTYLVDPVPFKTDGTTVQKESWDDI
ncbi:MAG: hypothetical protein EOP04_32685 [Proteobacteria bacterium]|nr:MAG: hypothetical protein EOP04_32685 [Pseudomonadota bacterium]